MDAWTGGLPPVASERPRTPTLTASMTVGAEHPRLLARAGAFGTVRPRVVAVAAGVFAVLAAVTAYQLVGSGHGSGARVGTAVVAAVVVFAVVLGLALLVVARFVAGTLERVYAAAMPPGSTLRVDYYPDRMVALSNGGTERETLFRTIGAVRVTKHCVVWSRGMGAGAFPIEVAPPEAVNLVRAATSGPGGVTR